MVAGNEHLPLVGWQVATAGTSPRDPPARLSGQSRCFRMTRESCISTPNWLPRWVKSMPGRISDEEFYAVICDDAAAAEGALGDQVVD